MNDLEFVEFLIFAFTPIIVILSVLGYYFISWLICKLKREEFYNPFSGFDGW